MVLYPSRYGFAILKKFLPDKNSTELAAGSEPVQIKIIRDSNDKGS